MDEHLLVNEDQVVKALMPELGREIRELVGWPVPGDYLERLSYLLWLQIREVVLEGEPVD